MTDVFVPQNITFDQVRNLNAGVGTWTSCFSLNRFVSIAQNAPDYTGFCNVFTGQKTPNMIPPGFGHVQPYSGAGPGYMIGGLALVNYNGQGAYSSYGYFKTVNGVLIRSKVENYYLFNSDFAYPFQIGNEYGLVYQNNTESYVLSTTRNEYQPLQQIMLDPQNNNSYINGIVEDKYRRFVIGVYGFGIYPKGFTGPYYVQSNYALIGEKLPIYNDSVFGGELSIKFLNPNGYYEHYISIKVKGVNYNIYAPFFDDENYQNIPPVFFVESGILYCVYENNVYALALNLVVQFLLNQYDAKPTVSLANLRHSVLGSFKQGKS